MRPLPRPSRLAIVWCRAKRWVFPAIVVLSLYLLLPSVLAVLASWRSLAHLSWPFAILVAALEVGSLVCVWQLDRIALHTRDWFAVATAQLAGGTVGRILPGDGAAATAFSASMLRRAGVDAGEAATAFGASAALQIATRLALPVLALPAIAGDVPVSHGSRLPPISASASSCCSSPRALRHSPPTRPSALPRARSSGS
jgi:uncharacterized membrane protein YbhN (UPF0104 family)